MKKLESKDDKKKGLFKWRKVKEPQPKEIQPLLQVNKTDFSEPNNLKRNFSLEDILTTLDNQTVVNLIGSESVDFFKLEIEEIKRLESILNQTPVSLSTFNKTDIGAEKLTDVPKDKTKGVLTF